jgi:hypothetical protein
MSRLRLVTDDPDIYIQFTATIFPLYAFATCSICGCLQEEFGRGKKTGQVIELAGFHLIRKHGKGEWV